MHAHLLTKIVLSSIMILWTTIIEKKVICYFYVKCIIFYVYYLGRVDLPQLKGFQLCYICSLLNTYLNS